MLRLTDYQDEIDDLEPGQTIRVNHVECEAGEDTRQRLYITRAQADPSSVLGYCHNCQQGGKLSDEGYHTYRQEQHDENYSLDPPPVSDHVVCPSTVSFRIRDFPSHAKAWLYTAASTIPASILMDANIGYDASTDRMYLPEYADGVLVGYQLRKLRGKGPKYITVRMKDAPSYTKIAGTNPKECCLVEDLLSGLAVLQSLNCDVFVLHGTNIDPTLMHRIAGAYDRAIVWLDNDSDHVCHQAELMERTIKMYSNTIETERVLSLSDPKKFTKAEIWEAINGLN